MLRCALPTEGREEADSKHDHVSLFGSFYTSVLAKRHDQTLVEALLLCWWMPLDLSSAPRYSMKLSSIFKFNFMRITNSILSSGTFATRDILVRMNAYGVFVCQLDFHQAKGIQFQLAAAVGY